MIDLSNVPRPLYLSSLKVRLVLSAEHECGRAFWAVAVTNDSSSTIVARDLTHSEAFDTLKEVENILKAHRILIGRPSMADNLANRGF